MCSKRGFSPDKSRLKSLLLCVLLTGCGGGSGGVPSGTGGGGEDDPSAIVAWGDSFTLGAFATSNDNTYPGQLAQLTGRTVFNKGIGAQTSSDIAARQGGAPARLTLVGDAIPDSGSVTVAHASAAPIGDQGPEPIAGTLQGVRGTLSFEFDGDDRQWLQFNREGSGSRVDVPAETPFLPDRFGRGSINVFWMGRNNNDQPDQVIADLQACVASLQTNHFVILGVINAQDEGRTTGAYADIVSLNQRIAQTFPGHYIDIRAVLVEHYNPGSLPDQIDHLQDVPPSSLRADEIHPNDAGYGVVAQAVADFIGSTDW